MPCWYKNCPKDCKSIAAHKAIHAAIAFRRREQKQPTIIDVADDDDCVVKAGKSARINYRALVRLFLRRKQKQQQQQQQKPKNNTTLPARKQRKNIMKKDQPQPQTSQKTTTTPTTVHSAQQQQQQHHQQQPPLTSCPSIYQPFAYAPTSSSYSPPSPPYVFID